MVRHAFCVWRVLFSVQCVVAVLDTVWSLSVQALSVFAFLLLRGQPHGRIVELLYGSVVEHTDH